jgi:hypothetical protein
MIKALEVPLSIAFWVLISWTTIPVIAAFNDVHVTVTESSVYWISQLQRAFLASIPASCVFLVEKILIEFVTVNYHRTQFSAKIHELKRRMHLFERRPASEALAHRVFTALVAEGNDALYQKDIERVLGAENEREVEEIFHALDKDGNGDVSLYEMTMMVIELGEGRRAMTRSLHDVDRAIKALDRILMVVVLVGAGMIYGKSNQSPPSN